MNEQEVLAAAEDALGLEGSRQIARGAQKTVYRADQAGTPVVLKVALLSGTLDPHGLERCRREVDLLRRLDSPHLVKVLSELHVIGPGPDAAAWLEEDLDGADLGSLLGQEWTWDAVEGLLLGVGSGLSVMHANGYVHRDLSPGNVRQTSRGWKVMDPGFAKHLNRTSITGLWQPGTLGYLSPEHGSVGGRVTAASDVFCLGILAFIALTGSLPIDPQGASEAYRQRLLTGRVAPIASLRPDLSATQAAIIDRCLTRQPARRYLDAGEVVDATRGSQEVEESSGALPS